MFRFEDLEVWKKGAVVASALCREADEIEAKKKFRFAEQLRGAALSILNNIAEGSGSTSKNEFAQFLNYSRRSVFECANMVIFFNGEGLIEDAAKGPLLASLEEVSKMISGLKRSL